MKEEDELRVGKNPIKSTISETVQKVLYRYSEPGSEHFSDLNQIINLLAYSSKEDAIRILRQTISLGGEIKFNGGEDKVYHDYPEYECNKIVRAFKIKKIVMDERDMQYVYLHPEDPKMHVLFVERVWCFNHAKDRGRPITQLEGGYVVFYADGYVSWSPAKAFEEGYHLKQKEQ